MSDFPFSIGGRPRTDTPSYFGIDFFPRTFNGDLDGLQFLTQVGPDPTVGPNPIMFINLPFSYKVIGLSASFDTDSGSFDYDFQIFTRDVGTGGNGAAVGDVIQFSTVTGDGGTRTHSALFTTPQDITSSKDVALNLDSTASGGSPEFIIKLWCQTV